jgi:thiol-disulfide isomerase/thioredoxin
MQYFMLAAILDDPATLAQLSKTAAGSDIDAARAKGELAIADFVKAADDAQRNKALDELDAAVKPAPGDDSTLGLLTMTALVPSPSIGIYQHLLAVVKDDPQAPSAEQMATMYQGYVQQKQMEGKPLAIDGVLLGGQKISTSRWKGKVILVDFWATWCPPCLAGLPDIKKAYADYHDKGLEVLGVSSDNTSDDLQKFLTQNPDMPWPQLFDDQKPGWNAVAASNGVWSLPTIFLIDRKGILRTVEGRDRMADLIPKLLAEKP